LATTRPFAYNTGTTIPLTLQVGSLAIGQGDVDYSSNYGGVQWWMGPDEDLGYVIAKPIVNGDQPNPLNIPAYLGFERSESKTEQSFLNLVSVVFSQTFNTGSDALTWLNNNGYWTSFVNLTPTPTQTPTITPTITPTKTPTNTPTPSVTNTLTPSVTPSFTPTNTLTPSPSVTPTQSLTPTKTTTPTPTLTPTPTQTSYSYYRWQITASKTSPPNSNCVQASEFVFQLGGIDQSMAGVTVTNPSGSNPVGEEPSKLVDGLLTTKGLDLNFVSNGNVTNFIFQFSSSKAFNGYRWATANDEESRDPKSWTIAGSNNGTTWTTLHTVTNFSATAARQTYQTAQTY
jgi:hypothetical protein